MYIKYGEKKVKPEGIQIAQIIIQQLIKLLLQ